MSLTPKETAQRSDAGSAGTGKSKAPQGAQGGRSTSTAKGEAARTNGQSGGRPATASKR